MAQLDALPTVLRGRILVAGAGVSGVGVTHLLNQLGLEVVVADDDATARHRLIEVVEAVEMGTVQARRELASFSIVITSPGWRPDSPLLLEAAAAGLEVIGDVELAWRLDRAGVFGAPRTWLAVTGTNGKTTTTAMLAAMMVEGGFAARAVGNIGVPVAEALAGRDRVDVLVAELSSFQLHWAPRFTPDAGVLLNLAEDHIDWHGSFRDYALAKTRVLHGPVAVIGADDAYLVKLSAAERLSGLVGFTLSAPAPGQLGVRAGEIVDRAFADDLPLASAEGINPTGPAGVLDALAAAAIARSQGVSAAAIARALADFEVAGHRGQVIASEGGVDFIDNSKATNPHAADSALAGHDSVIWIVGGQLKGTDITPLVTSHAHRLKAALILGIDGVQVLEAVRREAPAAQTHRSDSTDPVAAMRELLDEAFRIAVPGDTVLLAPAAASLDMYKGMGQRGDIFAHLVADTIRERKEREG